jgi:hypothetical protein
MNLWNANRPLAERLVRCLPAASFEMETLVGLAGVEASRDVATAAVTCEGRPRLLLNPDFVARHCQSDEHLFLLTMHELWHVLLAHTTLYPRATEAQNIAFDAIINAGLCRQFPGPEYRGFFEGLNPVDSFPGLLLRPPEGWPENPRVPTRLGPSGTAPLVKRLYPAQGSAGVAMPLYSEILELLEKPARPEGAKSSGKGEGVSDSQGAEAVLIGNHASEEEDAAAANDSHFGEVVRRIVARWPPPPIPLGGRDTGDSLQSWSGGIRPAAASVRRAFAAVLRRALGPVPGQYERRRRDWVRSPGGMGPIPSSADRLSPARRALGLPDTLHPQIIDRAVRSRVPATAHVYLDVSGSMFGVLPYLTGLLAPYVQSGQVHLFQFSTEVAPVRLSDLRAGTVESTGGTCIECVLEHALDEPRLRSALVLTDGYVGRPTEAQARAVVAKPLRLHAVLPAEGSFPDELLDITKTITTLPPLIGGSGSRRRR